MACNSWTTSQRRPNVTGGLEQPVTVNSMSGTVVATGTAVVADVGGNDETTGAEEHATTRHKKTVQPTLDNIPQSSSKSAQLLRDWLWALPSAVMHGTVLRIARSGHPPSRLQIDGEHFAEPTDAEREIDLSELYVLPGLADCHAHLAADSLRDVDKNGEITAIRVRAFAQLGAGVFLVIDKGWRDEVVLSLLRDPPPNRPHLEAAARIITGPHGYFPGFADETDEAGLAEAVRAANTTGGWVKLVGDWPQKGQGPVINFGEEALAGAVRVAHEAGARVAIHAMAPDTPSWAVRAGVDSIEHGLYLKPGDLETLGARGGAWVPTIGNTLDVIEMLGPGSSGARILGLGLENIRRLLQAAVEAGVSVLAGTDLGLSHGEVAREAAYLNRHGLGAPTAVDSAGPAAYRYLGIPHLEAGASADLLLFDEDPTADVAVLGRPLAGIRAGKVVFDRTDRLSSPAGAGEVDRRRRSRAEGGGP